MSKQFDIDWNTESLDTILDKIDENISFFTDKLFEKNQNNKDLLALLKSLRSLYNSFFSLTSCYTLICVPESQNDVISAYKIFFDKFKQIVRIMTSLFLKYTNSSMLIGNNFSNQLETDFKQAIENYNIAITGNTNLVDINYLNNAYFAYLWLIRGFNSMVKNYNKNHIDCPLDIIENVPEPPALENFTDKDTKDFIVAFINDINLINS